MAWGAAIGTPIVANITLSLTFVICKLTKLFLLSSKISRSEHSPSNLRVCLFIYFKSILKKKLKFFIFNIFKLF